MSGYNKVILMGNLTGDPKAGTLAESGTAVCEFGLAVNRRWNDGEGQVREEVLFIDCNAYGKTAQAIGQYLSKGSPIHIEGRLKLDRWEQEGQSRSKIRVIVERFRFVGMSRAQAERGGQKGGQRRESQPARQMGRGNRRPAPVAIAA